jgi:plasmid stability protein
MNKAKDRRGSDAPSEDRLHVRLSPDLKRAVRIRAARLGITMSDLARSVLRREAQRDLPDRQ